jgi:ASCH domain
MSDDANRILEFAWPGPIRDDLVARVLSGEKTATTSLLVEWEVEKETLPTVGERQTVVDSAGDPVGVVEILASTSSVSAMPTWPLRLTRARAMRASLSGEQRTSSSGGVRPFVGFQMKPLR